MSLTTPVGMLMFTHLFVPRPRTPGADPVFNLILLFDAEAQKDPKYAVLKLAVKEAAEVKFGKAKIADPEFMRKFRSPFNDALDKEQYAGFTEGKRFIAPWTKTRPGLVDGGLRNITAASDLWAGQLGRCTVSAFAYETGANRGVNFMLNNVQVTKADMPRMDGRTNAAQDFDRVDGATEDDGDAPF